MLADRLCKTLIELVSIPSTTGHVVATRFIGGGKQLHGLRKRQSGRIARNRSKTGICKHPKRSKQ